MPYPIKNFPAFTTVFTSVWH